MSLDDVMDLLAEHEWDPDEPYPGDPHKPWLVTHMPCWTPFVISLDKIITDTQPCPNCAAQCYSARDHVSAASLLLRNNWIADEPWPGNTKPWKMTHAECGHPAPNYFTLEWATAGSQCQECRAARGDNDDD